MAYSGQSSFVNYHVGARVKQLDITTFLDLVGLALVSTGSAIGLWPFVGGFALLIAGIVLITGSQIAARL